MRSAVVWMFIVAILSSPLVIAPPSWFPPDPGASLTGSSPENTVPEQNATPAEPVYEELPPSPPSLFEEFAVTPPASSPVTPPASETPAVVRDAEEQTPASISSLPAWAPLVAFTVAAVFILQTVLLMVVTMKVFHHDHGSPPVPRPSSIEQSVPTLHSLASSTLPPRPAPAPDAAVVQTLRTYVATCRAQGFPDARIREQLQQSNRLPAEIDMAMAR